MKLSRPLAWSAGVLAAMAALSAWAWPHLPPEVTTHWNAAGRPDRAMPRAAALAAPFVLALGLTALFAAMPRLMPARARLERSAAAYEAVWLAVLLLPLGVLAVMVATALGAPVSPVRLIAALVGLVLLVVGNYLGKTRYNYVMGVRTPWTLASERVWDRTHRFTGRLMVAAALVLIAAAFVAPTASLAAFTVACGAGAGLCGAAYSYLEARRLGEA